MRVSKAATVYAKTLLESAASSGASTAVLEDMRGLANAFVALPALRRTLENPVLPIERKVALLEAAVKNLQPLSQKFVKLLTVKNRLNLLGEAAEEVVRIFDHASGLRRAVVQTAKPISAEQSASLARFLQAGEPGTRFELRNEIVPEVLSGFRILYDDRVIDATLSHKLETLKAKLAA